MQLAAGSQCFFPHAWHGDYFHLGFGSPLVVSNSTISEKGRCVESFGSHYVMEEEDRGEKCWRCMTIFRKHHNVLQYKESYCETYFSTFRSLCENIAGDSPMYSMFRRDSEPVRCPFKGPFTFSYSKGGSGLNQCSFPKSYLDSCSDHRRLQVHFQACIDVQGSESAVEQMECLAHWKEGSKHYMVAEMSHDHVHSDETRYRCFVYEKAGKGDNRTVTMAQSLSATCRGLWSPTEGYRTFKMEKVATSTATCHLPRFLTSHRTWSSLEGSVRLHLNSGERSLRLSNLQDSRHPEDSHVSCHKVEAANYNSVRLVTFVKSDCDSGFVCSEFLEEADGVVRVNLGQKSLLPSEACTQLYFSSSTVKSLLMVSRTSTTPPGCPMSGHYLVSPPSKALRSLGPSPCPAPTSSLVSGCGSSSMKVEQRCPGKNMTSRTYTCTHHWSREGVTHVVISNPSSPLLLCLSYTQGEKAWISTDSCSSKPEHTFSLSQSSPCVQTLLSSSLSSNAPISSSNLPTITLFLLLLLLNVRVSSS